jgi:hypothetical protein
MYGTKKAFGEVGAQLPGKAVGSVLAHVLMGFAAAREKSWRQVQSDEQLLALMSIVRPLIPCDKTT